MTATFVNTWKSNPLAYDKAKQLTCLRLIEFSIFRIQADKRIDIRVALFGFSIEMTII